MNPWLIKNTQEHEPDLDILEEAALAMAQAALQNAINRSGISRAELARRLNRPPSFITRMLSGNHNLTVKTMARALAACGREIRFSSEPLAWSWPEHTHRFVVIEGGQCARPVPLDPAALLPSVAI